MKYFITILVAITINLALVFASQHNTHFIVLLFNIAISILAIFAVISLMVLSFIPDSYFEASKDELGEKLSNPYLMSLIVDTVFLATAIYINNDWGAAVIAILIVVHAFGRQQLQNIYNNITGGNK